MYKAAVLTISDKCSKGQREDETGKAVKHMIAEIPAEFAKYDLVPDESEVIKEKLISLSDELNVDLILTNGGTGFSKRDVTPEATKEIIDKEILGIPEAMRIEGLKKTNRAILSRGIAGIRNKTLIINLPGSVNGAKESLEIIIPVLIHSMDMIAGKEH